MDKDVRISRRGVYYDLSLSPYEYKTSYGDILKFRSQKKLDMYEKTFRKKLEAVKWSLDRHGLSDFVTPDVIKTLEQLIHEALYAQMEK